MKRNRILIGPKEIAGYYANLAKGFDAIGVTVDYVTYNLHPFDYGGQTRHPLLLRLAQYIEVSSSDVKWLHFCRWLFKAFAILTRSVWGLWAIFRYDTFIFGFGSSLLIWNWDLPILKLLGKVVISNLAHGSEARPAFMDGAIHLDVSNTRSLARRLASLCAYSKSLIDRHEAMATIVIGHPLSVCHYSTSPSINSLAIGIPMTLDEKIEGALQSKYTEDNIGQNACRILHAPSNTNAKGTENILQAINRLKQKGYSIELILISGKSNHEVLSEIQKCDFVVDQVFSDGPMAGFATEAAWFAKPAVVGGYGLDLLKETVSSDMWPPSKICHPDHLDQAIEELISDYEQRVTLGKQAQLFVQNKWNAEEVARKFLRLIDGDIPHEWWFCPGDFNYLEGACQNVSTTQQRVRHLVHQCGIESLQLGHRPDLEAAFLDFAGIDQTHESK
jgi:hypothetical protein